MESNEADHSKKKSGSISSLFQRSPRKENDSSNEGAAVQEFMLSFRKKLTFGPNFVSFMYPSSTSNDKGHGLSDQEESENGLSNNMSALFVISAITGSAILSLPLALKDSGNI
ncbi:hypothetical protein AVEN_201164-1 [Araneus ventricosus]|uniref:Uncharacterized protein n=1 Tax=Araneus ventricosus TaxID=182803 RepID=A0A4Y2M7P8_ARAVE|nr:hypothetical protein AVEN_201164-1 [Araneus ventricosus]